jgi:hypothetical protein
MPSVLLALTHATQVHRAYNVHQESVLVVHRQQVLLVVHKQEQLVLRRQGLHPSLVLMHELHQR